MQRYSKILFYINKNTSICIFIIYLFMECDPASPPMSVECLCRSHPLLKVRVCKYRTNGSLIRVISCHEPSLLMFIQYFSTLFRTFSFPADCVRGQTATHPVRKEQEESPPCCPGRPLSNPPKPYIYTSYSSSIFQFNLLYRLKVSIVCYAIRIYWMQNSAIVLDSTIFFANSSSKGE